MTQLHKRFSAEQVKVLLKGYQQGSLTRIEIQEMLGVGKTRFFAILKQYQHSPEKYDLKLYPPNRSATVGRNRTSGESGTETGKGTRGGS